MMTSTYTITFGDQAENHVGMQKLGALASSGFSKEDLTHFKEAYEAAGNVCKIVDLHSAVEGTPEAYILIVRGGVPEADALMAEQAALPKDTKALMYGRVVNKHARHNLCFADEAQEPDYTAGKGRIVAFETQPLLSAMRTALQELTGRPLVGEGNYYYDVAKCGIGFHGDTERRIVIGARLGASMPLHYQWFKEGSPVGPRIELMLGHGDLYFMSAKAVGFDWKSRKPYTLRHAAGAKKFLTI